MLMSLLMGRRAINCCRSSTPSTTASGGSVRAPSAHLAAAIDVAPAEIFGVASFYDLFSLEPRSGPVVHRCVDIACQVNGAVVADDEHASPCLGLCERAPAALVIEAGAPPRVEVRAGDERALPQHGDPALVLLRRVGVVDPDSLDDYRVHGGYAALRQAVALGPSGVLRELGDSGLVGRGGAAFPTGRKWSAVASQPSRPKYVVANADESEPGTFKDRVVMERDPFALVEATTIGGFAVGAERGYIYMRGEYPEARRRVASAIDQAYRRGYLGADVMGLGFDFDLELRIGAGAYICGEETALFNSLEGFRGEPRSKPPFPVEVGLFGQPTLVNNVETLINVLPIVLHGGQAFAATGIGASTGTKLFCVSGRVGRPGLYELTFGATLRELLTMAGGRRGRATAAGRADGGRGRRVLDRRRARHAAHVRGVARGERHARLGCGRGARRHGRCRPRCSPASPPSSATRAAVSASRAGSARSVKWSPSIDLLRPARTAAGSSPSSPTLTR